jgi:small subunit ribosomal protein S16
MIKIRLSRVGRTKKPLYTIVACDSRTARDGKFIEKLGQYDPANVKEPIKFLKKAELSEWIKKGAQVSDTVNSLFKKHQIKL